MSSNKAKQQKFCPNEPGGRARLFSFFSFFYLFHLINELNSISLLTSLKDALERGAHDDSQSPLPGQVGPGTSRV